MTGLFASALTREELEQAAASQTRLEGRIGKHLNLRDANLDGLILARCDLSGSDLRGANLSGARLSDCRLHDTDLVDACLAESTFHFCDFSNARWGSTILTASHFAGCAFAGISALRLDWWEVETLSALTYHDRDRAIAFDGCPITLTGPQGIWCKIGAYWIHDPINKTEDDTLQTLYAQAKGGKSPLAEPPQTDLKKDPARVTTGSHKNKHNNY